MTTIVRGHVDDTELTRRLSGNPGNVRKRRPRGIGPSARWRDTGCARRRWTLNYFNATDGLLTQPLTGEFRNGRGVFFGPDTLGGRAILVRFVITKAENDSYRFEQSFSGDGGETWELNWVATDTKRSAPRHP
jgi:hypothetical protein